MINSKNKRNLALVACFTMMFTVMGCQSEALSASKSDPVKAVKVRTQLAAEYIKSDDIDAAKRILDEALKLSPRDSFANMMMGVLLQKEGSKANVEKAERYFKTSISSDPKNAQARNNYGTYLYQIERYNEALEQFNIAGSTLGYDQRYTALENMGRVYVKVGDIVKAEESFNQALRVNKNSYIAMLELAEINYFRQNITTATQLYENSVKLVGQKNQQERALWIGIRIARANGDNLGMQVLVNQLRAQYPKSQEYQRYLQLQYSTEAVWK